MKSISQFTVHTDGFLTVNFIEEGRSRPVIVEFGAVEGLADTFEEGLKWLNSLLDEGEEYQQTIVEPLPPRTLYPSDSSTPSVRPVYQFAVTVTSNLGQRTLTTTTEQMPDEMREAVIGAIAALAVDSTPIT